MKQTELKPISKNYYLREQFRDKEKAKQYLLDAFETDDNEILACVLRDVFIAYSDDIKNYRYTINKLTEQNAALTKRAEMLTVLVDALEDVAFSLGAARSLLKSGGRKAADSDKMFNSMLNDYKKSYERGREALAAAKELEVGE